MKIIIIKNLNSTLKNSTVPPTSQNSKTQMIISLNNNFINNNPNKNKISNNFKVPA